VLYGCIFRGANHSPPSSAKCKTEWSGTSTPPFMISRRVHGQIYPLVFLLLTHSHLVFQIYIFSFPATNLHARLFSSLPSTCPSVVLELITLVRSD